MKLFWKILFLAAGLGLFGWYISSIGVESVFRAILSLGAWGPFVLIPYLVVYVVDCFAWAQTLPRTASGIPFTTLLRIRWCGESVNNLLPSAYVAGEALKVVLLRSHHVSAREGATSAVVSKTAQTFAQLFFILLASIIFLLTARHQAFQQGLRTGLIVICSTGCAAVAALFAIQKFGFFRMMIALLEKVRLRFRSIEAKKAKLLELDATIFSFYHRQPRRFYSSALLYFTGWMLDSAEIYLVGHLLDMPVTWSQAIVMEAFIGIAKVLGMWIPGSLGVQESGIVLLGRLTGLSDTFAAAYAVIRRARELVFAVIGLLLLYTGPGALKAQSPVAAQ
jgi:uncharacterized protein (TIRG00374 family)